MFLESCHQHTKVSCIIVNFHAELSRGYGLRYMYDQNRHGYLPKEHLDY